MRTKVQRNAMSTMFSNNEAMIRWGRETVRRYGRRDAVRAASTRDENGWWIVPPPPETAAVVDTGKAAKAAKA